MHNPKAIKYTVGEIGRLRVIEDFLPSPDPLLPREENLREGTSSHASSKRKTRTRQ
jgi:hypothetical protein